MIEKEVKDFDGRVVFWVVDYEGVCFLVGVFGNVLNSLKVFDEVMFKDSDVFVVLYLKFGK